MADPTTVRRPLFGGRKLVAVVKREFLERVRTRWFLISTLLGPVFFAAITILPAWLAIRERGSGDVANIVVVDATGAGLGDRIARALADSTIPAARRAVAQVVVVPPGAPALVAQAESSATRAVVRKERLGYLVVDNATLAGRRARYSGRNASSIGDVDRVRDVVARTVLAARLEREGLPAERVLALSGTRLRVSTDRITDDGRSAGSGAGGAVVATLLAFLLYIMIILYGQNVLRSVLEEKTTRVAEVIVASVKPDVLMAGKVLGVGAVGLVQQLVWFAGAAFIGTQVAPLLARAARTAGVAGGGPDAAGAFGAFPELGLGVAVAYLAFFLLGYLLYSALFAAVGAMVSSEQEAQQAAFPVMMPLIASAVLIQLVIRNPESATAKFAAWFPLTAPVIMPMRMSLVDVGPGETTAVIAGLSLTVLGAVWLAARVYRVGLLMYGKRPGLAELARWVRQAA